MRVMLIHPGAPFATADVADGYAAGLRALGVEVEDCALDQYIRFVGLAIDAAGGALRAPNAISLAGAFVAQQALISWPDLVIAIGATNLHRGTAAALTRAGLKTVAVLIDSPYLFEVEAALAGAYTYATTNERTAVAPLREAVGHRRVRYLPTGYHPLRHTPDGPRLAEPVDVAFVGSLFAERTALFQAADFAGLRSAIGGLDLAAAPADQRIIANEGTARLYRTARVNLNPHRTTMIAGDGRRLPAGGAESVGPRAYEIAACGGFQLMSDDRVEARELFGAALTTYRAGDADDLTRQTRRWLAMDGARERIATDQCVAVQGHSYTERARALLEWTG